MDRVFRLRGIVAALFAVVAFVQSSNAADEIHWTLTGQDSVTLNWRGSVAEDFVRFGKAPGVYTDIAIAPPPRLRSPWPISSPGPFWEAKITGLAEDTLYYYSIADGPEHTFRTPPFRGASGFTVFAEADVGDSVTYPRMGLVQGLIAAGQPDFVLVVGDIAYADDHGQQAVDQHFSDVMVWSRDAAYMPAWGNHEWEAPASDDLRNYKGRFDFPNPQTSANAPLAGCCGEDWYWFDYGNIRFIAYPEPWEGLAQWLGDWTPSADGLMAEAEADPDIDFIVTFGHRPAYSSGHSVGLDQLRVVLDELGAAYSKYVLNINGHSHNYERTLPQSGVVHITVGTGGTGVGGDDPACRWSVCPPPAWSAFRASRTGALRLDFTATSGKPSIDGSFICGPASSRDDISCVMGEVIDSFSIGPNLPPESAIDFPLDDLSIQSGDAVSFEGSGTDPDGDLPLGYLWDFDGGAPDQGVEDPGTVVFSTPGIYNVTFTVTDALGRRDPTPDSRAITVTGAGGTVLAQAFTASSTDDAEESASGTIGMSSSDLELVWDGSNQTVGLRFDGVAVPQGSQIVSAFVQFKVNETTSTETTLRIQGEAADDALAFDWTTNGISSRPRTAAEVLWTPPPWTSVGEVGLDQRTPNIAAVIHEITDRPGWSEGNAIVLIATGTGERVAESYDGDPAGSPAMYVEFIPPNITNTMP